MAKFLRFIGFMVLALALWQTVSDTFANKAASGGNVVSENTIESKSQLLEKFKCFNTRLFFLMEEQL